MARAKAATVFTGGREGFDRVRGGVARVQPACGGPDSAVINTFGGGAGGGMIRDGSAARRVMGACGDRPVFRAVVSGI